MVICIKLLLKLTDFKKKYFAEEIKDDLYAAIDGLKDKLSELVLNTKQKEEVYLISLLLNLKIY